MKIRSCWVVAVVLTVVLLSTVNAKRNTEKIDLVQDAAKIQEKISFKLVDENEKRIIPRMGRVRPMSISDIMKIREKRQRTDEVAPMIRSIPIPQKLTMAISTRISNTTSGPIEEVHTLLNENNSRENGSKELMLPISTNASEIISNESAENSEVEKNEEETPEALPEAQELRRTRIHDQRRPFHPSLRRPPNRRNVYTSPSRMSVIRQSKRPMNDPKRRPTENECTFFTKTVCLEATYYPHEAIIRSLRSNKEMVAALLTDYKPLDYGSTEEKLPIPQQLENKFENRYENRYESNEIKRSDTPYENVEEGFTCPSTVKYARPQLARAASGVWKYIINTGEHTQTLRLEKCSNTQSGCSFISGNYRSSCVQVYNYHRLLTWEQKLGLHMDIFKVPTCCSCHVHGYADLFPPHQKDPPTKPKETFPGVEFSATNEQKDEFQDLGRPTLNSLNKYSSSSFDSDLSTLLQNYPSSSTSASNELAEYISFPSLSGSKKPVLEIGSSRPSFTLPGRTRTKKPSSLLRPFEKLPQQHAPNTRAPGYKGPLSKGNRPNRFNRPHFRRDSASNLENPNEIVTAFNNNSVITRFNQPFDQQVDATSRLQNGGFDDEYHEPQRRINYNYHPIIDFFKPEALMLQSEEPLSPLYVGDNAWKPIIS